LSENRETLIATGDPVNVDEKAELAKLRKENAHLRMEREF
jgi:hypothetical protein